MKNYKKPILACIAVFVCLTGALSQPHKNLVTNPGFEITEPGKNLPLEWEKMSPRDEISPVFSIDRSVAHSGNSSLRISSAGSRGTYGYLKTDINRIASASRNGFKQERTMADSMFLGGKSYLVEGYFRVRNASSGENVRVKVSWTDKQGRELFSEFIRLPSSGEEWQKFSGIKSSPVNATGLSLSLILQWTPSGTVWFDDISVAEALLPPKRLLKIATATNWAYQNSTTEKNLQYYSGLIAKSGSLGADIICLGEGITVAGTGKTYADVSETVPGPTSKLLGEAAAKAGIYVIAGIYEREGSLIYNTALLIDPNGNIAGKYRKTHLPQTEVDAGITPGDTYPVFKTKFGNIGIEICYDNFFPEVARSLMLNGAEIIFCPIWGDIRGNFKEWFAVSRTRAIDNGVFFAASMYEKDGSVIIDPDGNILPDEKNTEGLVISTVDLNHRTFERWLSMKSYGEWKNLFLNERRPETYKDVTR